VGSSFIRRCRWIIPKVPIQTAIISKRTKGGGISQHICSKVSHLLACVSVYEMFDNAIDQALGRC
jgi:hypothetical protein